ncbi:VanZ family protein [Blautia sp. MSJ-19]|uniref:VanZ family protein n=1 Tax=Blautia sp. MSJ-19 TaxID=2841517 RepID=UPI001C0EAA21
MNHDKGAVSAGLTQVETTEGNVTRTSYVDGEGKITYAIDRHYATLVRTKDTEGRLLEERYLDENGEPTDCWGYFGISYKHRGKTDILTYLDAEGNPMKTGSGYAVIVRSFDDLWHAVDDMYYDTDMNAVMCTGGYYGLHRIYDKEGRTTGIIYLDMNGLPTVNLSGFAQEKRILDEENRIAQKFYYDIKGKAVRLQAGQAGEAYTYDEYNRIIQVTFLNQDGEPAATKDGYVILKKTYYRDGNEKTNMYFDASGNPVALNKGQYGIQRVGEISLYLNKNGQVKLCIDNLLNAYPVMVVIVGIVLCILFCLIPQKLRIAGLLFYVLFIFYETLMFREIGDVRANLVLFSYADTFLTSWKIRVDVLNNVWLFIPFGTGLYAIFGKKKVWLTALALSGAIESIQYFTGLGIAELDDLFGNTLGGVLGVAAGVAIFYVMDKWRNMSKERTSDSV